MDNLDLFPDFDIATDPLVSDLDLTLPDLPELAPDELRAIVHLLPADFGKPTTAAKPTTPARTSLTLYSEKISMRIPRSILAIIKEDAKRRGIPYQTFINMMLAERAGRAEAARNS